MCSKWKNKKRAELDPELHYFVHEKGMVGSTQHPYTYCPICAACTVDGEKEMGSGARKRDSKKRAAELLLRKLKEKSQPCQVADVNKDKSQPFQAADGI